MNRRWICSDVWMDIFPSFDHAQLGLKIALLSDRFDVLVDAHFDGKKELTLWREIIICEGIGPEPTLSEWTDDKCVEFPLPDRPLPNKIRVCLLRIDYIDHSVIEFLHSNKQIWDRSGTKLELSISNVQPIWDVLASEIWPVFATNIHHLGIDDGDHLDNLRRLISPTILTDLDQLHSFISYGLFPDGIADDGPNATAGQALTKWLHTPSKDGQPKRLFCADFDKKVNLDWVNSFKEAFLSATTSSVSYKIRLELYDSTPIGTFELVNERTKEKLTLDNVLRYGSSGDWLLKRCPISEKASAIQWENYDYLNYVQFNLYDGKSSIGPYGHQRTKKKRKRVKASKYRRTARKTN